MKANDCGVRRDLKIVHSPSTANSHGSHRVHLGLAGLWTPLISRSLRDGCTQHRRGAPPPRARLRLCPIVLTRVVWCVVCGPQAFDGELTLWPNVTPIKKVLALWALHASSTDTPTYCTHEHDHSAELAFHATNGVRTVPTPFSLLFPANTGLSTSPHQADDTADEPFYKP